MGAGIVSDTRSACPVAQGLRRLAFFLSADAISAVSGLFVGHGGQLQNTPKASWAYLLAATPPSLPSADG